MYNILHPHPQYFISDNSAPDVLRDTNNDDFIYVCIAVRIHHIPSYTECAIWFISAVWRQRKVIIMVINAGIWEEHCRVIVEEREMIT